MLATLSHAKIPNLYIVIRFFRVIQFDASTSA